MTSIDRLRNYTNDDAMAEKSSASQSIANLATQGASASDLHDAVQRLAEIEESTRIHLAVAKYLGNDKDLGWIRTRLVDVLLAGPDDTWSGRGNDLRRVRYDAMRRVVTEITEAIDFALDN